MPLARHDRTGSLLNLRAIAVAAALLAAGCGPVAKPHPADGPAGAADATAADGKGQPAYFTPAAETGINFVHSTAPAGSYFFPEIVGSGVALLDYDNDGDLDVYCVNLGDRYDSYAVKSSAPVMPNRLYEQTATGQFADVTAASGLGDTGLGMGVAVGDVNNDGLNDVLVTNAGHDRLYINQGGKKFSDMTEAAGIESPQWGAGACFFDYDRDGWLDLYIANYVDFENTPCTQLAGGGQDYCAPHRFTAYADKLYRNTTGQQPVVDGVRKVKFEDVSRLAGIDAVQRPGLGVRCGDFNGDNWPDIYVANDQAPNLLWINQRNGAFSDEATLAGCAVNASGKSQASMGIAVGDINADLRADLLLTHLQGEHHTLYTTDGNSFFSDDSLAAGLETTNRRTGFGAVFLDVENDGDLDLFIANGAVRRPAKPSASTAATGNSPGSDSPGGGFWRTYAETDQLLLNNGSGKFNYAKPGGAGSLLAVKAVSRGVATGDLDNDGDLDLVINDTAGRLRVYFSGASKMGAWVRARAVEPAAGGRDAYGATVVVRTTSQSYAAVVQPGGSYLSSNDARLHFGLGEAQQVVSFTVTWNDGVQQTFTGGAVNRQYELRRKP